MTTIILISLGILLAAASALMSIHYGGEAMRSGGVKAQAATLDNAAQNVRASLAGRSFAGVRSTPSSIGELSGAERGSGWIEAMPDVSQAGGGTPVVADVDGSRIYGVPGVPETVCVQVNADYRGTPAVPDRVPPSGKGCVSRPDGTFLFYVVLGPAA